MDAVPNRQGGSLYTDPVVRCLATAQPCLSVVGLVHTSGGQGRSFDGTIAPTYGEHCRIDGVVLIVRPSGDAPRVLSA